MNKSVQHSPLAESLLRCVKSRRQSPALRQVAAAVPTIRSFALASRGIRRGQAPAPNMPMLLLRPRKTTETTSSQNSARGRRRHGHTLVTASKRNIAWHRSRGERKKCRGKASVPPEHISRSPGWEKPQEKKETQSITKYHINTSVPFPPRMDRSAFANALGRALAAAPRGRGRRSSHGLRGLRDAAEWPRP